MIAKQKIIQFIEENVFEKFHKKRIESIERLELKKILKRKNIYMFRAKNMNLTQDIVKSILDAHLSSQEETIFGDFLEQISLYTAELYFKGRKSSTKGIDLEIDKDNIRYLISVKSGPNWGNASQIEKMLANFQSAKKTLNTSGGFKGEVKFINGCCYGKDKNLYKDKGYYKYCGQVFWEFISGESDFYKEIIDPLGKNAQIKNEEFFCLYEKTINKFNQEFSNEFSAEGLVNWIKLLELSSKKLENK